MGYKKKILWLIGIAALGFVITVFFENLNYRKLDAIQQFLGLFSIISFILLIALYFLAEPVFVTWKKFARIYLPIAAVLVIFEPSSLVLIDFYGRGKDREGLTMFLSGLFILISLILIVRAHRRLKRQSPTSSPLVQ